MTIHASSGMPSKNYDYYNDIIDLIYPSLLKRDIKIIQIGGKDDELIKYAVDLRGKTNIHQSAHILERSALHLGNDTFSTHIAGFYKVPLVCLYAVAPPSIVAPYWNDKAKTSLVMADLGDEKPSYSNMENPKNINKIKPEIIAEKIANLLGFSIESPIETIFIGSKYKQEIIELIPNQVISLPNNYKGTISIRADYYFNEENIYRQISVSKCVIIIDKLLNIEILKNLRANIAFILYKINMQTSIEEIQKIKDTGIPYGLFTEVSGDNLNQLKLKFLDFNPITKQPLFERKDIEANDKINSKTRIKSRRLLLSNGKFYISKSHWEAGINSNIKDGLLDSEILIDERFWKDIQYYNIYNRI